MDWIRKQARLYQNLAQTMRYQAVVHLEDKEDEYFWDYQLQSVKPSRYRYLYYSKSDKGTDSRGCEQCLRFRPYLTDRFFICIDSDLRLLRGEQELVAANHIAQTYTYSWENHLCEASHLNERKDKAITGSDFDLQAFLQSFSKIVYKPLLYLIQYGADSSTNQLWNVSKFNACIPLQPGRLDLADNGAGYLAKVKENFDKALIALPYEVKAVEHLTEENAYLHIQGHQLYKLMMHIGSTLCSGTGIAFKSDILDKCLHTNGYEEIESLQSDLRSMLHTFQL
ncbi:MAG: DUF4435 domain-containing protein [Prevotella sp.]